MSLPASSRNFIGALAPLLIAGGFAGAHAVALGWPRWPVNDATDRVLYWIAIAAILGVVADILCDRCRRWAFAILSLGAAVACLMPNLSAKHVMPAPYGWPTATFIGIAAIASIVTALLSTLSQRLVRRDATRPLVPLVLAGMAAATAGLVMSTGSLRLGQSSFCLAGAVGAYALLALFIAPIARSSGAILVTFAAIATQLASGYLWSEMPLWSAASILVAPLIAWVIALPPLARRPQWLSVIVALLLAALPASIVVGKFAADAYKATAEDTGGSSEFDESSLYK